MRGRTVVVLLVMVAAMAAFIAFYERDLPSSDDRHAVAQRVLGVDAEAVRGLTIESAAGTVQLERGDDDGWRLLQPLTAAADGDAVDQLIAALVGLDKQRTLSDVDAGSVGLDAPRLRVDVQLADGIRRLDLGSAVPGSKSLVAAVADDPHVYVVGDAILGELEKDPDLWRDRVLFHGDRTAIERLVVTVGSERRILVRSGAGFRLQEPVADLADETLVEDLMRDLEALRVGTFLSTAEIAEGGDDGLGKTGLSDPESVLEVYSAGEEAPFRLEVGASVGELPDRRYGRVGEQLFEADSELFELLARPTAQWPSQRWSGLRAYQVDGVTLSGRDPRIATTGAELEWSRNEGRWQRGGQPVEGPVVDDLLDAVTGARAEEVVTGEAAADLRARLGDPAWTLSLASSDLPAEELSAWAPGEGGRLPVGVSGRDSVLLLSTATAAEIDRALAAAVADPAVGAATAAESNSG